VSRFMAFVDGENLTVRFEAMVKDGRKPRDKGGRYIAWPIEHLPGLFVWHPATIFGLQGGDLIRVLYYSTFVGGADGLESFRQHVASRNAYEFIDSGDSVVKRGIPLIPRIFHKTARNTRTKSVDINLCVDVLEYVRQDALDAVYLVTGDVDYLPLVEAVMRAGKRVFVAALSSGLSNQMRYGVDQFNSLNERYFFGASGE
jgi:hypothetical protein